MTYTTEDEAGLVALIKAETWTQQDLSASDILKPDLQLMCDVYEIIYATSDVEADLVVKILVAQA